MKTKDSSHPFDNDGTPCTVHKMDFGPVARLEIECHKRIRGTGLSELMSWVYPVLTKFVDKPTGLTFCDISILAWLEGSQLKTYIIGLDPLMTEVPTKKRK